MYITEVSIRRPVVAWVMSLILIVFGIFVFFELPVRENPDGLQPPVVQVRVDYKSASASIINQEITQVIEDIIGGAEGIKNIDSSSENGSSSVNIEFNTESNIDSSDIFNNQNSSDSICPNCTDSICPNSSDNICPNSSNNICPNNTSNNSHVMYSMNQFNIANNNNNWPKKTDIHCWWCCHSFNTVPVAIPTKYCNDSFTVYGCFCSYNCAMAYIFNTYNLNTWEQYSLLKLMYYKTTNLNTDIKCAPKKEILTKFGGTVDINSFRKSFTLYNLSYRYITPPMTSIISHIIEDSSNNNVQNINETNENNFQSKLNTQSQLTTQYKLKRVKSLINTKNSLEVTMGLKIN